LIEIIEKLQKKSKKVPDMHLKLPKPAKKTLFLIHYRFPLPNQPADALMSNTGNSPLLIIQGKEEK